MRILVKRLTPTAKMPEYKSAGAVGLDLYADNQPEWKWIGGARIGPGRREKIETGISIELPDGYEGQVRPRSGNSLRGVDVAIGTIDHDYRGGIGVTVINNTRAPLLISPGDRIAQLVIAPIVRADIVEVDELSITVRGGDGYGSTGR